jgi:hypothetical protein
MEYFAKEFAKADNDPSLSKAQDAAIHRKFFRASKAYSKQLQKLRPRLSKQAWNFFYLGFGRWGLHDAELLSFAVGDGLDYRADGRHPFAINKAKTTARIRILNRHQNLLCTFTCSGVLKAVFDYPTDDPLGDSRRVDMLLTYELTAADSRHLCIEFLFVSGATILVEFTRLKFSRERIHRRYPSSERYS